MGRLVSIAFGVMALGTAGCAEKPPEVYPVRGALFWDGKPAVGAVVFFHPMAQAVDQQNPANEPRPTGKVQEDGSFDLGTFGTGDGAPAGRYRVSVVWTKSTGEGDDATHLLPEKYMSPATAGLPIVEVREQPTVLAPFKLSS